jgi:hypothetical protein
MVPASTLDFPLLSDTARRNAMGHWLILYLSPTTSEQARPVRVFVGDNVANVLAITSTSVTWLMSRVQGSLLSPSPLTFATPPAWSSADVINITRWWGRDLRDRRFFRRRHLLVNTTPTDSSNFAFILDTGSPVNLWPTYHAFTPPSPTALVQPIVLRLIDHISAIRLTHQVSISFRATPTSPPTTLIFYVCPDVSIPTIGSYAPPELVRDWFQHSLRSPGLVDLDMTPELHPPPFVRPTPRGFTGPIPAIEVNGHPALALDVMRAFIRRPQRIDSIMSDFIEELEFRNLITPNAY